MSGGLPTGGAALPDPNSVDMALDLVGAIQTGEGAVDALTENLVVEVFEDASRYLGANGQLNFVAVFYWLVRTQRESGLVSEASLGTAGSRWLLARKLGETLQDVVSYVAHRTAAEAALHQARAMYASASMMMVWRMNDTLSDQLNAIEKAMDPDRNQGTS